MKKLLFSLLFLLQIHTIKPIDFKEQGILIMNKISDFKNKIITFNETLGGLAAASPIIVYIGFGAYYFYDVATNKYGHPKPGCPGKFRLSSFCPNCGKMPKN